jgi:hypothetical protein
MEKGLFTITLLLMLCAPAAAEWNLDGFPLHTIKHGTIEGGMYIEGGHGRVFTTSYTQNFTVPNGTIKWARLYVSAKDTTWINTSINGYLLGNYTDPVNHPKVYTSYKEDRSMCWAYYDNVTEWIVNGHNTATAKLGTRVDLYTKSWGMVLLVVYEGGDDPILLEYWVNEGNPLLHANHLPFSTYHNTTNTSFAGITDLNNVTSADLWTVYIWGSEESEGQQHDTLWFNSELIAEDASDGAGTDDQGNNWRGGCFDLKQWDVSQNLVQDNIVLFDRGEDSLLSPVETILVLNRGHEPTISSQTVHMDAQILPAISLEVTPDKIDFGILAPGWQSYMQQLTIDNTGSSGIIVTAGVTDTANNLYNDGLLFDSDKWSAYSESIMKGEAIDTNVVLDVPGEYTGFGILNGTFMLWAETI